MSATEQTAEAEIKQGERFAFGKNWARFLSSLDRSKIEKARESMEAMVGAPVAKVLKDQRFLDAGSGSGLSSLVAHQAGARVHAFDFDLTSVACTKEVKQRFGSESSDWLCEQGSVLDDTYLASLGRFDWVYSWGVLHHTGDMWKALDGLLTRVDDNGFLFVALYNDQGWISRYWRFVKRTYNAGAWRRRLVVGCHMPYLFLARWLLRAVTGRLNHERGMSLWWDMLDWLGGYPFEVATPLEVIDFIESRGFRLRESKICGHRHGCNEFVFQLTKD